MRKVKLSLVVVLALAVLATVLAGCGRRGLININGDKIAKDEFYARLERVPVQTMKGGKPVTVPAGQYVIEQIISEKLVQQLAKKENVFPTDTQLQKKLDYLKKSSGGSFKQQLAQSGMSEEDWKRQMATQQSLVNIITKGVDIPDSQIRAMYDASVKRTPSPFVKPAGVRISVIITEGKDKIDKAYSLLNNDQDFGSVAMQLSEDKATAQYQGAIPTWLTKDMTMVPAVVRSSAFSLGVGKYSKPVLIKQKTSSQWAIIKVTQKRDAHVDSYNDVKDLIKEQLAIEKGSKNSTFNKQMQDFVKSSKIVVNAERYKQIPEMMKKGASAAQAVQTGATAPGVGATAAPTK